jgi:hypothetical protein
VLPSSRFLHWTNSQFTACPLSRLFKHMTKEAVYSQLRANSDCSSWSYQPQYIYRIVLYLRERKRFWNSREGKVAIYQYREGADALSRSAQAKLLPPQGCSSSVSHRYGASKFKCATIIFPLGWHSLHLWSGRLRCKVLPRATAV